MTQLTYMCKDCNKEFDVEKLNSMFYIDSDYKISYKIIVCPSCNSTDLTCLVDEGYD